MKDLGAVVVVGEGDLELRPASLLEVVVHVQIRISVDLAINLEDPERIGGRVALEDTHLIVVVRNNRLFELNPIDIDVLGGRSH